MDKRHWTRHFHWRHSSITKDSMDIICHLEHLSKNLPPFGNNWRRWRNNLQLFHVILPRWFIFSWFSINLRGEGGVREKNVLVEAIEDIEWTGGRLSSITRSDLLTNVEQCDEETKIVNVENVLGLEKEFQIIDEMEQSIRRRRGRGGGGGKFQWWERFILWPIVPNDWYHSDKKLFKWNFFFIGLDNDQRGRGNWSIFGIGQQVEMFISQPLDKSLDKLSFRNSRLKRIAPQWGFWVNCCKRKRGGKNSSIVNIERNIPHWMMFVFFFTIISSRGNISIRVHLSIASFGTMEINGCACFSLLSCDRCPTNRSV